MPYVTDDDSKAVKRIAEIERELQERNTELDEWLATGAGVKPRSSKGRDAFSA